MKIRIDIDENLEEAEIVIKCKEITDEITRMQSAILESLKDKMTLELMKEDKEFFLSPEEILFFESQGGRTYAHTASDTFETKLKLYELEKMLPRRYLRVSKSAIIDVESIYSIAKNITGPSIVQFRGTHKQINVSRQYFSILKSRLKD